MVELTPLAKNNKYNEKGWVKVCCRAFVPWIFSYYNRSMCAYSFCENHFMFMKNEMVDVFLFLVVVWYKDAYTNVCAFSKVYYQCIVFNVFTQME